MDIGTGPESRPHLLAAERALRPPEEHEDGDGPGPRLHARVGLRQDRARGGGGELPAGSDPPRLPDHPNTAELRYALCGGAPYRAAGRAADSPVPGDVRRAAACRSSKGPAAGHG